MANHFDYFDDHESSAPKRMTNMEYKELTGEFAYQCLCGELVTKEGWVESDEDIPYGMCIDCYNSLGV